MHCGGEGSEGVRMRSLVDGACCRGVLASSAETNGIGQRLGRRHLLENAYEHTRKHYLACQSGGGSDKEDSGQEQQGSFSSGAAILQDRMGSRCAACSAVDKAPDGRG